MPKIECRYLSCFIGLLLTFFPISLPLAKEHLVPDVPRLVGLNDYALKLKSVFQLGFSKHVLLRVLVYPSFGSERMIGIKEDKQKHYVFSIIANESIFNSISIQNVGSKVSTSSDMSVNVFDREISLELIEQLKEVWKSELLNVRHSESPPLVIDGTSYEFSMFVPKYGEISGRLNYFEKDSKMALLAHLTEALERYSKGEISESDLDAHLARVLGFKTP